MVQVLREDQQSRRAVAILARPAADAGLPVKDVACANSIQFLVRDNKLNAVVTMRSNDAIWGLPYDIFFFTMLQEMLSVTLGLKLGTYYHFAGSLHLYDQHLNLAHRILADKGDPDFEMPSMPNTDELTTFLAREGHIRLGARGRLHSERPLDKYWQDLLDVLFWFAESRLDPRCGLVAGTMLQESLYAGLARNWSAGR
jgi:thymidylate synthase